MCCHTQTPQNTFCCDNAAQGPIKGKETRFLGRSARSALECGSLLPLWCARRRTAGRKRASGHQGGSFATALHSHV
jgi:hypothetical protein